MINEEELSVYKSFINRELNNYSIVESKYSILFIGAIYTYKIQKKQASSFGVHTIGDLCKNATEEFSRGKLFSPEVYLEVVPIRVKNGSVFNYAVKEKTIPNSCLLSEAYKTLRYQDIKALFSSCLRFFNVTDSYNSSDRRGYYRMLCLSNNRLSDLVDSLKQKQMENDNENNETDEISRYWLMLNTITIRLKDIFILREKGGYIHRLHGDMSFDNIFVDRNRVVFIDPCVFYEDLYTVDILSELATIASELLVYCMTKQFFYFLMLISGESSVEYIKELFDYYLTRQLLIRTTVNYVENDNKYQEYLKALRDEIHINELFK